MRKIGHFIDGRAVAGRRQAPGRCLQSRHRRSRCAGGFASAADLDAAVKSAAAAQPGWAATNPQRRARVLMKFVDLLNQNMKPLAELMSREHGKTVADSVGDITRGLEVAEFSIGIADLIKGEFTQGAGPGIDMYSMHQPVGIGAGITPFNFPAMIPLWMFMPAIACGNAFILKPSERDPSVPVRLAELLIEAGLPQGHLQCRAWRQGCGGRDPRPSRHSRACPSSAPRPIAAHVYATRRGARQTRARLSAAPRTMPSSCPMPISRWRPTP